MRPTNKKTPGPVAQLKTGVPAQSNKRPVAPPVYRPQPVPKVLQTKSALPQSRNTNQTPRQTVVPVVQRKEPTKNIRVAQLHPATAAKVARPLSAPPNAGRGAPFAMRVIQRSESKMPASSSSSSSSSAAAAVVGGGSVKTAGGTWVAREYNAKMGVKDPTARGLHIVLEFNPEHPADATKIVLVQTVLSFKNDDYYFLESDPTVKVRSAQGASIDQVGQSVSPVYAADPKAASGSLAASPLQKGAGDNGYRYRSGGFGSIWRVKPAWLTDNPHLSGVHSFGQQMFETTAIAVEGHDAGSYYGSVRWGWTWNGSTGLQLIPLSVISYGSASELFSASAHKWNETKTSGGQIPVQLPEVRPRISSPAPKPPPALDPRRRFNPDDDEEGL